MAPFKHDMTVVLPSVDGYRLHDELGQGGFATVYRATQIRLNRVVALKIMNPAYAADPGLCERFIREGHDMAAVSDHENIVTVYDVGHQGSLYYIAMQYLPGPTLKQLLASDRQCPHPLHIIKHVAHALAYVHRKGYVHRDVKPANILFNVEGKAVLSDFGIAKAAQRDQQLTQYNQMIGTTSYMSPEQAMCLEDLDGRSDIYSLGVVFYQALTRKLPYSATAKQSVVSQHIQAPVPELPENEAQYQPLINRMMAKDPHDRFESADALIEQIQRDYFSQLEQPPMPKSGWWMLPGGLAMLAAVITTAVILALPIDDLLHSQSPLSAEQQKTIEESMELAELNELMGRIDSPPGSNAVELYELVLEIDPQHEQALAALKRLRNR